MDKLSQVRPYRGLVDDSDKVNIDVAIIVDHVRIVVVSLSYGSKSGNKKNSNILRQVIRRALKYGLLNLEILKVNNVEDKVFDIINRYARFINSANILQERFFRRVAFQARLDKNLKEKNFPDINTIDPKKIPAELLDDAVQHALDISFASIALISTG